MHEITPEEPFDLQHYEGQLTEVELPLTTNSP
jgi:hypothetical protein